MANFSRKSKRFASKSKKAAPYKRRAYKKKTTFAKKVKSVIHKMAENKTIISATNLTDIVPMSSAQFTNIGLIPITISQGATSSQRIGNQIDLVRNYLRMYFTLKSYNVTTNPFQSPIQVCLWIYSFKALNAYSAQSVNIQDLVSNQLFQSNNASVGTQKSVQDLLFTSNTELIQVHRKIMFTLGTPTSSPSSTGFNSDGHPFKFLNLNLSKYAKRLVYNDTQSGPTNKNLYMLMNTYHTDGTTYADAERMVAYTAVQTWKYEDL